MVWLTVMVRPIVVLGGVFEPQGGYIWGIDNQQLSIQRGQIITEASLVFKNFRVEGGVDTAGWNRPARIDADDFALLSRCWQLGADERMIAMEEIAQIGRFWLAADCGNCGGIDATGDEAVGLDDLIAVTNRWLMPAGRTECGSADWNGDGWVNPQDLLVFAELWLEDAPVWPLADPVNDTLLKVYVLGNPRLGFAAHTDSQVHDPFAGYGGLIRSVYQNGDLIYRLGLNHDPLSPYAQAFDGRLMLTLADGSRAILTSSLMELIDSIGSGISFGFGIYLGQQRCSYDAIRLALTVQSYDGEPFQTTVQFEVQ